MKLQKGLVLIGFLMLTISGCSVPTSPVSIPEMPLPPPIFGAKSKQPMSMPESMPKHPQPPAHIVSGYEEDNGTNKPKQAMSMPESMPKHPQPPAHIVSRYEGDKRTRGLQQVYRTENVNTNTMRLAERNDLVVKYIKSGRFEQALPLAERVFKENQILGKEHPNTLASMNNLAIVYQGLGRFNKASQLFWWIFQVRETNSGEKASETLISMNNLAGVYLNMNRFDKALPLYKEGFKLHQEVFGEKDPRTLTSLHNLANIYLTIKNFQEALPLLKKSLDLHKKVLGENHRYTLNSMNDLAKLYIQTKKFDQAKLLAEKSFQLCEKLLDKEHPYTLESLDNLAIIYAETGDIDNSIKIFKQFVEGVETLRSRGDLSTENRQALFKQWTKGYYKLSRLYVSSASHFDEAFRLSEMTKARTLVESMTVKLAAQKAELSRPEQQRFQEYQHQITALNDGMVRETDVNKKLDLEIKKNQVVRKAADFHRRLMKTYPKYAQLNEVQMVTADKGAKLLPSDTLFISYLVQDNHVIVFTLDATGDLQAADLGDISGLEQTIATYRELLEEEYPVEYLHLQKRRFVYQQPDGSFVIECQNYNDNDPICTQPRKGSKKKREDLDRKISHYLGQKLLAPIKDILDKYPRWIISPDGALALIPFEALILNKPQPVIAQHEISYVQSLSVLALLKKRQKAYQRLKGRGTLLAMGAPRYHRPDNSPKICNKPTRAPNIDIETTLTRSVNDRQRYQQAFRAKNIDWCNLPGAEQELSALEQLFADEQPMIYKQAAASEANLQRLNRENKLTRYRYLMFSAHGYFDAETPLLSAIILDQLNNTSDTDGYITASEWPSYDLKSDLMVLSACETGVGKVMRGEGIIGLPYALYVAGNQNTLMTLWKVPDKSTAEFISRFFTKLKGGMNQVTALTETKREFFLSDNYKRPLFWAPFVLYGI